MKNRISVNDVIILDEELSKKIGLEQVFMLKVIIETGTKGEKVTQKLLSSQTEGFIKKPVTVINDLKKVGIVENFGGELIFLEEKIEEILKGNSEFEELSELKKITVTSKKTKEEKIKKCTDLIVSQIPFQSDELYKWVTEFVKEKFKKGEISEKTCGLLAKELLKHSKNNEEIAINVVQNAILGKWNTFWPLREDKEKEILNGIKNNDFLTIEEYEEDEEVKRLNELIEGENYGK